MGIERIVNEGDAGPPGQHLTKLFTYIPFRDANQLFPSAGSRVTYIVVVTHIDEFPFHPTLLTRTHHLKQNSTTPSPSNFYFLHTPYTRLGGIATSVSSRLCLYIK